MRSIPTDKEIDAEAQRLGLADDEGRALRQHRSKVAAILTQAVQVDDAHPAARIRVSSDGNLLVNDIEVDALAADPIHVVRDGPWLKVQVTLWAESFQVDTTQGETAP